MNTKLTKKGLFSLWAIVILLVPISSFAQESNETDNEEQSEPPQVTVTITPNTGNDTFLGKNISFDLTGSQLPEKSEIKDIRWDFGDGSEETGDTVNHTYKSVGSYIVQVELTTNDDQKFTDTTNIRVFEHVVVLATDSAAGDEQIEAKKQQAAKNDTLLLVIRAHGDNPQAVTEEALAGQLIESRDAIKRSNLLITWTSGSIGPSILSQFAQRIRAADELSLSELNMDTKGIIILSDTPFGVLSPTAQNTFDQLNPEYVLLTRPEAINVLLEPLDALTARNLIFESPVTHRLLGTFSARNVETINVLNFLSVGINFLINRGVPVNNITLVLMIPVIATILSFARQVIGIKAFGLVTPAITTLSFLVIGLQYGLVVFFSVLLAGTLTRIAMRKLHLLYLPRMALVLTSVSFAILGLLAFGAITKNTVLLSFSIFPILILTLLAEEFIALQFKSGARRALNVTALTLLLAILSYYIVSWELLRTIIVSYPETVLLTIPVNVILGRWSGLRLTEYFRFRKLLKYSQ